MKPKPESKPIRCLTCGIGIDSDGDGDCAFCSKNVGNKLLKALSRLAQRSRSKEHASRLSRERL